MNSAQEVLAPMNSQIITELARESDSFGHELRVARALSGFSYEHCGTYHDVTTGKPRQYDLRASLHCGPKALYLAVECKKLHPSSPLVVAGVDRAPKECFHQVVHTFVQNAHAHSTIIPIRSPEGFYPSRQFVGKSLIRIELKNNGQKNQKWEVVKDSDIYDPWVQAIGSSVDLLRRAKVRTEGNVHYHSAVLPMVIVPDGTLWELKYNARGEISSPAEMVESSSLYLEQRVPIDSVTNPASFVFSHLHFFTVTGLHAFVQEMLSAGQDPDSSWHALFSEGSA